MKEDAEEEEEEVEACSSTTTSPGSVPPASNLIVTALSAAEIPVEMPFVASTVTVNAVLIASSLCAGGTIRGRASRSQAGPGSPTQSTPEVSSTINAILPVVAASAARIKSPSFSLSASSRTTTNSPRETARRASGMELNPWAGCGATKDAGQGSGVEGGAGTSDKWRGGKSETRDTAPTTSTLLLLLLLPTAGGAMALALAEERGRSSGEDGEEEEEEDEDGSGDDDVAAAAAAARFVVGLRKKEKKTREVEIGEKREEGEHRDAQLSACVIVRSLLPSLRGCERRDRDGERGNDTGKNDARRTTNDK